MTTPTTQDDHTHHTSDHTHLVRLVVQDDQVSVAHVEPREVLTRILSIKYVLIDNKRCALCVRCIPTEQGGREGGRERSETHG